MKQAIATHAAVVSLALSSLLAVEASAETYCFQQGQDGYTATVDTVLMQFEPDTDYSGSTFLRWDFDVLTTQG